MASVVGEILSPVGVASLAVMRRSGLLPLRRVDHVLRSMKNVRQLGPIAGSMKAHAVTHPDRVAIVDELGPLTYRELNDRANALAHEFLARGLGAGSIVALLARDHRNAAITMVAAGKAGAKLLLANTGFAGPQLVQVAEREGVRAFVADQEFAGIVAGLPAEVSRIVSWVDDEASLQGDTLDALIEGQDTAEPPVPEDVGGFVLLTSGTTGTPKGAPRQVRSPLAAAQFLDRIPLQAGEPILIAAPLFHATGFSQFTISVALGATVVLRRRFDPEQTVRALAENRCTALVVVPTMMQRMVDLGPEVLGRYDTSALKIVFVSGSQLLPELGDRFTAAFGDVIHNLYGSTEVSVAAVATPEDWKQAPGTVGRPPVGCTVKLFDLDGAEITEPGVTGRIFAGSGLSFEGYTDGRTKEVIDGLMSTGDVGHRDSSGLLFVDGRDDDMIISGGENVFPVEIENLLSAHPHVVEAAVVGVDDDAFGQRPKAYVVRDGDAEPDEKELAGYVRDNLARYKVPREFVFLDALPRNATGKVLRNKLHEHG